MKIQLINEPNLQISPIKQVLLNRGLNAAEISHYLNLTEKDVYSFLLLGEEKLKEGAQVLLQTIQNNDTAIVIVDCDCDGYTSAALLINYLYFIFPTWIKNNLKWIMHDGKAHGLNEHLNLLLNEDYKLIITPDGGSNDYLAHKKLKEQGKNILVLDHHPADKISEDAIVINNQLSDYPNKNLSGVGVTWQFCRYIDSLMETEYANSLIDLVALGLCGDMMSLKSFETRYLITKGFQINNIHNPFIDYMIEKNNFPLNKPDYKSNLSEQACTNIGAAFFIVPFVNAVTRSGTLEEKNLIFKAMLSHRAFDRIPEIKRNKLTGKEEILVLQAVRIIGNIKNRQTRAEEKSLKVLNEIIEKNNMLKEKILLFLLQPNEIDSNIRGLVANKLAIKYTRPCLILTYNKDTDTYDGSMRGYTKNGLKNFKNLLRTCPGVVYVQGHPNASGVSIKKEKIDKFLSTINLLMRYVPTTPIYEVDYFFDFPSQKNGEIIMDIAQMNDYWGQDIDRAYVGIKFKVTQTNFSIMKSNTLKITLNNNLTLIKFNGTQEDIDNFTTDGWVEVEAYCKCNRNEWNDRVYAQLIIEDYEIIDSCAYLF